MYLHVYLVLFFISLFSFVSSCTIYQSPERTAFESESPTFRAQSLQKISCSGSSVKSLSSQSRLITITDTESIWEHIVYNESKFESDNFKKEYCLYEISH